MLCSNWQVLGAQPAPPGIHKQTLRVHTARLPFLPPFPHLIRGQTYSPCLTKLLLLYTWKSHINTIYICLCIFLQMNVVFVQWEAEIIYCFGLWNLMSCLQLAYLKKFIRQSIVICLDSCKILVCQTIQLLTERLWRETSFDCALFILNIDKETSLNVLINIWIFHIS